MSQELDPGGVSGGAPRLLVEAFAFGRTRLCSGGPAPWRDVAELAAFHRTLDELVDPDALVVPADDCYATWHTGTAAAVAPASRTRRPGAALKELLAADEPRAALAAVIAAVAGRGAAVALGVPAPGLWAQRAAVQAGEPAAGEVEGLGARAAVYVAAFLRSLGGCDISYVLVGDGRPVAAEELEPLVNVADHYRWRVGVCGAPGPAHFAMSAIAEDFWAGAGAAGEEPPLYARVPAAAAPDLVLDRLSTLKEHIA